MLAVLKTKFTLCFHGGVKTLRLFSLYFKGPYVNLHHSSRHLTIHAINRVHNRNLFLHASTHRVHTGAISFCLEKAPLPVIVLNFDNSVILLICIGHSKESCKNLSFKVLSFQNCVIWKIIYGHEIARTKGYQVAKFSSPSSMPTNSEILYLKGKNQAQLLSI